MSLRKLWLSVATNNNSLASKPSPISNFCKVATRIKLLLLPVQGFLNKHVFLSTKSGGNPSNYGQLRFFILCYNFIEHLSTIMPLYSILLSWENLPLILQSVVFAVSPLINLPV